MNQLLLMSGLHHPPGFVTLDANPAHRPDILSTIPPVPELVKCALWDRIEWIHGINVVYPWHAKEILREVRECLAPDGVLVLEQPDITKCFSVEEIYGDPVTCVDMHMVKWGYSPNSLLETLRDCGFRRFSMRAADEIQHVPNRDFRMEVRR